MATTTNHTCPLCHTQLTRKRYEEVVHLEDVRKEHDLAIKTRLKAIEADRDRLIEEGRARGRDEAAGAAEQIQAQLDAALADLGLARERHERDAAAWKERIDELQRRADLRDRSHFGPEGEEALVATLKGAFPEDRVQRLRTGGDVLHSVLVDGRVVGTIVYECKRVQKLQLAAVRQLKRAMAVHDTRHGILVSAAPLTGRPPLCLVNGVLVAAPGLVEHIVGLVRQGVIELDAARVAGADRARKETELLAFACSDEVVNAFRRIEEHLQEGRLALEREKTAHISNWAARDRLYAALLKDFLGFSSRVKSIVAGQRRLRRVS